MAKLDENPRVKSKTNIDAAAEITKCMLAASIESTPWQKRMVTSGRLSNNQHLCGVCGHKQELLQALVYKEYEDVN